jgi:DNA-binding NtrC family response regulator
MKDEYEIGDGAFRQPSFLPPALGTNVLVVDDDPAWQRALTRGLVDVDVRSVSSVSATEEVEAALARSSRCVVLTELSLAGSALAGLRVVDTAHRARAPVAIVAGGHRSRFEQLRAVPFLSKSEVNRASLRALLRYLERGL